MRIIFLGTNGWYATNLGNTVSILIETENFYIILDAGDGIHKIDQYIDKSKPIIILLSHLHLDHIIGLHTFAKFSFSQEIFLYGYMGTKRRIKQIIKHPFSSPITNLPIKIRIQDLNEGNYNLPVPITCKLLKHADPCLGYRIGLEGKTLTYCTDTGLCDNLFELANSADLLITECSFKPGQEDWGWPHLKPEEAAQVALKAQAKKLILTHFDASVYKTKAERMEAEVVARRTFQNSFIASDDLRIDL
ncbi:MAG: MBL fold metallo-hydrolase [Candidatus Thorarchaeota archaeon]